MPIEVNYYDFSYVFFLYLCLIVQIKINLSSILIYVNGSDKMLIVMIKSVRSPQIKKNTVKMGAKTHTHDWLWIVFLSEQHKKKHTKNNNRIFSAIHVKMCEN